MGGRGRDSGITVNQLTITEYEKRMAIKEAIQASTMQRESMNVKDGSGGLSSPILYKKCACCGEYSILADSKYETCPICGWIDDPYQNQHPESLNGKNPISLLQAREKYMQKQGQQ
jgi:rubrerythrin